MPEAGVDPACAVAERTFVVSYLEAARIDDDGVSPGFDLDGITTTRGEFAGCGHADQMGTDGQGGIDNNFATLIPALEQTEANVSEELLNAAIKAGELLLMFRTWDQAAVPDGVTCDGFEMLMGVGQPMLSGSGDVLADQTFLRDDTSPSDWAPDVAYDAAGVDVREGTMQFVMRVLEADVDVTFHDAAVRLDVHDDGTASGVFAGAVRGQEVLDSLADSPIDEGVRSLLGTALQTLADLDQDENGICQAVSMTMTFEAVPAFLSDQSPLVLDTDSGVSAQ